MEFLTDTALHDAIVAVAGENRARCAVAFWGKGAETRVGDNARIICNLKMGGTNPWVIKKLMKQLGSDCVRQHDSLHAKVYLGRESAIITSANSSANGLGFEGKASYWREAGVRVTELSNVERWFEWLWERESRAITNADLKAAKATWKNRQRNLPTLPTFENFDVEQSRMPWPIYYVDSNWEYEEENIKNQGFTLDESLSERIDNGPELEHEDDIELMRDRWFLYWAARSNGRPAKRINLFWTHVGSQIIRGGFLMEEEKKPSDVLLASEEQPPIPFGIDSNFEDAFRQTISAPKFKPLTEETAGEHWYRDREPLLKPFWKELKANYMRLIGK